MQFANPIWLWALTGLLIPVGIHLLSLKEGKIIRIGSIRHLQDTNTKQVKSIRLNEFALLAMRCLLLSLLVFFLSGLHFHGLEEKRNWLLIENGLNPEPEFSVLIDSLKRDGFEIRSFSPGFPTIENAIDNKKKADYWSLLEELRTKSIEQAVVLSHDFMDGFKGKRIMLPAHIRWLTKRADSLEYILSASRLRADSVILRRGKTNAYRTIFENQLVYDRSHYRL